MFNSSGIAGLGRREVFALIGGIDHRMIPRLHRVERGILVFFDPEHGRYEVNGVTAGVDDRQRAAAPEQFMDLFQSELISSGDHTHQLAQGEHLGAALDDTEATAAALGAIYHRNVGAAGKQVDIDRHHTSRAVTVHVVRLTPFVGISPRTGVDTRTVFLHRDENFHGFRWNSMGGKSTLSNDFGGSLRSFMRSHAIRFGPLR